MKKILFHLIWLLFLCSPFVGYGNTRPVFQLDSVKIYKNLSSQYASYWVDEAGTVDIDDILEQEKTLNFQPVGKQLPNIKDVFWCKWQIQNVIKEPTVVKDWILDVGKGDFVDVYFVDTTGQIIEHQRIGELVPMSQKRLARKHVRERIPFSLPTTELITMYIRLQRISGFPPKLRLEIHQKDFYNRDDYREKVTVRWLFFGMLFTLAFLGLGFYPIARDKAFLYYGLFLLSLSCYMVDAFFNVYGNMLFFREHPQLIMYWVYGLVALMNVAHVMFIREYIGSKVNFPRWDRIAYFVVLVNVALGVFACGFYWWTSDEFLTDKLIIPVVIATYLFLFTIIIPILWYRKWSVENLLIFISVSLFTFAILINAISIYNGTNLRLVETQLLLTLVILIFSVGLAFGLGYRFHRHHKKQQEVLRLQDLSELKTRFYQNITHEFRTPLTVITGVTEQIQQEESIHRFPHISNKIEMIRRNGNNLLGLVNRLLEMAKLETGKMELSLGNGDIIMYLRYLVESIGSFADRNKIQLQFLTNLESLDMDYDQEKIRQILYNLISNAIKFSKESGKVKIFAEETTYQNKAHLLIQVKDEGVGIAKKDLPHVFDRFYQGEKDTIVNNQGSGIGLALTKELVRLMRGRIMVVSHLNKGTVVKLHLPIANKAAPFEKDVASTGTPLVEELRENNVTPVRKEVGFSPEKEPQPLLLLVEDNWDVLEFVKSILEKNYQVEVARNGQEGIDLAIDKIPDLIVSDVVMPEKSGYELLNILKNDERTSHIPIILLTAKNTQEDKLEGLTHGADAYLTKPFAKEELEIRVHNLLEHRRKLQEQWSRGQSNQNTLVDNVSDKDRAFLEELTKYVEEHIADEDLDVARMQRAVRMSRPQLHRKLKALTGLSAAKFRKKIRLQKAYTLLKEKTGTVAEVAYEVGYKHPSHFSSDFKEMFGVSPGQV